MVFLWCFHGIFKAFLCILGTEIHGHFKNSNVTCLLERIRDFPRWVRSIYRERPLRQGRLFSLKTWSVWCFGVLLWCFQSILGVEIHGHFEIHRYLFVGKISWFPTLVRIVFSGCFYGVFRVFLEYFYGFMYITDRNPWPFWNSNLTCLLERIHDFPRWLELCFHGVFLVF